MASKSDFTSIGSTGVDIQGGLIYTDEVRQLRDPDRAMREFYEMSKNSAVVGAILYSIESLFRQVQWRVEPADEDAQSIANAELLESCVDDMTHTWDDFISQVLSILVFGWAYFEIVYKKRDGKESKYSDGKIGLSKISIRAQQTREKWDIGPDGEVLGLWQRIPSNGQIVYLPMDKALLFRIKSLNGSPEGQTGGILRNAYRSWFYAKRIQEIEAIGIERDLVGYPVFEVPLEILNPGATGPEAATKAELVNMVQRIRRDSDEGALIPPELDRDGKPTGFKLRLLNSGGQRQMDTDAVIRRYETRMAQSVMSEFMMLGTEGVGSRSLGESKTKLFLIALKALRESIQSTINRFLVPKLMKMNGITNPFQFPYFEVGDFDKPDLAQISQCLTFLPKNPMPIPRFL